MNNQTIIQVKSSEPLPAQRYPVITIHLDLDSSGYSGLMGLLNNPALLALNESGATLPSQYAGFLCSAIESASITLGDAFHALCALNGSSLDAETHITPNLLADFGAMLGELLPFFARLSAELARDEVRQSHNP